MEKDFELGFHSRSLASIRGSKGFDWQFRVNGEPRMDANKIQSHCTAKNAKGK